MTRDLSRRLGKLEAARSPARAKRYWQMSDADLIEEVRQHTRELAAKHGAGWRDWLAAHEPDVAAVYSSLERDGVTI